ATNLNYLSITHVSDDWDRSFARRVDRLDRQQGWPARSSHLGGAEAPRRSIGQSLDLQIKAWIYYLNGLLSWLVCPTFEEWIQTSRANRVMRLASIPGAVAGVAHGHGSTEYPLIPRIRIADFIPGMLSPFARLVYL